MTKMHIPSKSFCIKGSLYIQYEPQRPSQHLTYTVSLVCFQIWVCVCRFANVNVWTVLKRGGRPGTTFIALYTEYQWDIIRHHWTRCCTVIMETGGLTNTRAALHQCICCCIADPGGWGRSTHMHRKKCVKWLYIHIICKYFALLSFCYCSVECWIQCLNWYEGSKIS